MEKMANLEAFRHLLHQQPEISGSEQHTAQKIISFLQPLQPDELLTGIGGHGVIARFGPAHNQPGVLFRAELDALPIAEINTFAHRSQYEGISHKCGHDGHATILCGLAQWLSRNRPARQPVYLLFQPAEETGEGAEAVLADARFPRHNIHRVFALHNLPGYPLGTVVTAQPVLSAAVNSVVFQLQGKTAHAAEPEHGLNPAAAIAEITQYALALNNNQPEKPDFRVVTPIYSRLGSPAYGTAAGEGELHFTLRAWTDQHLRRLETEMVTRTQQIAEQYGLAFTYYFLQTFHANQVHPEAVASVMEVAQSQQRHLVTREYPFKWGEDFGAFTVHYPGCMFGLGAGENHPALHNPDYDFPDALIDIGVKLFAGIAQRNTA